MHDSRNTRVYLSCSSRPIIENSSGIVFGPYPTNVAERAGITKVEEEWYVKELVEDFNWLRREHSPNWRISKDGIGDDTWLKVLDIMEGDSPSVEEIQQLLQ
jgi:tubulin-specific chaperone C